MAALGWGYIRTKIKNQRVKFLSFILIVSILFSCKKKEIFDGPNSYSDGFENYSSIEKLIDGDDEQWSFFQNTHDQTTMSIDSNFKHSGNWSFKSEAAASTGESDVVKASINKQFMAFWEGEIVHISMWYYMIGNDNVTWVFLFDLEEKTAIGAGPGMRLALVDGSLRVEHKFPNPDIKQNESNEILFPRDQWVHVEFETKLSQKEKGYVKVWQDDILILEQENWQTLPKDILYFQQGTKAMYSQIEFGVTAHTNTIPVTVYVDDIEVKVIN